MQLLHYIVLLFTLLSSASFSVAQNIRLYNASLTDTSKNYVYVGIDNVLVLEVADNPKSYCIEAANATLRLISKDTFVIYPNNNTDVTISVLKGKELFKKYTFFKKHIENTFVTIANSKDSMLTVEELLANPYLKVFRNDYFNMYDLYNRVMCFEIKFVIADNVFVVNRFIPGGVTDTIPVEDSVTGEIRYEIIHKPDEQVCHNFVDGFSIPVEYLALIKRLQPNDKILFENIKIVGAVLHPRSMPNMSITIVK